MAVNQTKLIVAGVIAVACIVALIIDNGAASWAVPVLGVLVGYIAGNAQVTSRTGATAPVISTQE